MSNELSASMATIADMAAASQDALEGRAIEARRAIAEMARSAAERLERQLHTAADGLASAASALNDEADRMPGAETVNQLVHATTEQLATAADCPQSWDVEDMCKDVARLVRNHPGPSLLLAAAFGLFIGRTTATSETDRMPRRSLEGPVLSK